MRRKNVLGADGWLAIAAIVAWVGCGGAAAAAARSGAEVYEQECSACHGAAGDGRGLAAPYLPVAPRDFVKGRFKLRSTAPGELPSGQDLLETVTRGVVARGMPAFDFLPEEERKAVVEHVSKLAGRPEGKVVPLPEEPAEKDLEKGRLAYERVGCGKCHLPNADDQPPAEQDLRDERGALVRAPHLLNDEFIGADGARDIVQRITLGMDGTPMPSFSAALSGDEAWAMAAWLLSKRDVKRYTAVLAQYRDPVVRGRMLVERFRCTACHVYGSVGAAVGPSLDTAGPKLRVEWLRAWLGDPRRLGKFLVDRPYRMPHLKLTPREVEDLTRLILAGGRRSVNDDPPVIEPTDPQKLQAGESLYRVMCRRCHALGKEIPASVEKPTGPDLIRVVERLHYPWLQAAIVAEGCTPEQAITIRDFLWKICTEKGPKPPVVEKGR